MRERAAIVISKKDEEIKKLGVSLVELLNKSSEALIKKDKQISDLKLVCEKKGVIKSGCDFEQPCNSNTCIGRSSGSLGDKNHMNIAIGIKNCDCEHKNFDFRMVDLKTVKRCVDCDVWF